MVYSSGMPNSLLDCLMGPVVGAQAIRWELGEHLDQEVTERPETTTIGALDVLDTFRQLINRLL